eukprot:Blabericola_migrator_1__6887@NODE_348_length_9533_cov_224_304141_g277_i2_p5_GENE_NODE_348_length_9533_cov_224_304141_g277_i2NODE_348_length_9533_cov_224_304141_g277_i2_p5_ORF_typecomplete_len275_score34_66zfC3HC4_2/PF13923_6/2_1e08zfC3HC4_2/PF13923_6/3_3e03zfC3HC4/PF00097_25/9_4e07zfRING_6/PF14835_6/1_3e05zfRING_6/PF14835_6/4_7e03Ubox/PF04564_15/0_00016zfC3HC4_4/PF15227_6/0_00016zfRING_UBOX/PF13445_6/0_0027RAWUL/PF16207_5/0_012zfC3HC4_3/PF13920_6/0_01zfC3HC4_3/PF13920_6/4_2e03ProkRING_4/PF14447_
MRIAGPQISPIVRDEVSHRIEYDREQDVTTFMSPDGLDVSFKIRVLADCLVCRLCNGFFRSATTIKECLHTYCRTCILKYLIAVRNTCPKCNTVVEGNLLDGLVSDQRLQNLVDKLFPTYRANDLRMRSAFWNFLGRYTDEIMQPGVEPKSSNSPIQFDLVSVDLAVQNLVKKACVKASFFPDMDCPVASKLPKLQRPYMILSANIPIKLLCKFLAKLLEVDQHPEITGDKKHVELWLTGRYLPLTHTLDFACRSRRYIIGGRGNLVPLLYRIA